MKKVILKSLLTSVMAAGAILMLASCIVFIENEFPIPLMIYFPEAANALFGIQLWYWIAFLFSFCYTFFFVFFPKRFWKRQERVLREVDKDSNENFQEKELSILEKNRNARRDRMLYFQFSGILCGLWMFIITIVFSQF